MIRTSSEEKQHTVLSANEISFEAKKFTNALHVVVVHVTMSFYVIRISAKMGTPFLTKLYTSVEITKIRLFNSRLSIL